MGSILKLRYLRRANVLSDDVTPTVGFVCVVLGMSKGVVYSVIPACTVRVLEPLVHFKGPLVRGAQGKYTKYLPVRVERRLGTRLRVKSC